MFYKLFTLVFIFINIFLNLHADGKQLIINKLITINNLTFDFKQTINDKKEVGTCVLVFNNKLNCNYKDSVQKRILINNKTLVIQQKRYNKSFFYPISKSPYINIFNKDKLINLIIKSDYNLNKNNIELTYVDKNDEEIIIFFDKNDYKLTGWKMVDQLKNIINFSIIINYENSDVDPKIFKVPSAN